MNRDDRVTWTHLPTGLSASIRFKPGRQDVLLSLRITQASLAAYAWLRAKVWGYGKQRGQTQLVRSWDLWKSESTIKDERTGKVIPFEPAHLNPTIDQGRVFEELLCQGFAKSQS